jgi:hypothetical protein
MKISIRLYIVVAIILLFADPGGAMIDPGTIIAAWHFDKGEGKVIRDSEGKRISGVVMGTGEWVDGVSGKALRFNGRDTYVAIGIGLRRGEPNSTFAPMWPERIRLLIRYRKLCGTGERSSRTVSGIPTKSRPKVRTSPSG